LEMDTDNFIGARGIINAAKILVEYFLSKIDNLTNIYMVSGNHDRVTPDKKHDVSGYAAELVADRINLMMPDVKLQYHPYLIKVVIDEVQYIWYHGDKMFAKKDFAMWVAEHLRHDVFNLGIQGHWHTTDVLSYSKSKLEKFEKINIITRDTLKFRKVTAPSIFTGNTYSETGGYSSNSGILVTSKDKDSKAPDAFFHYF
jgi:predicted phosphodiesterase